MARKLKKSTLFFSWNCFWNPVLAQGMKEPWNDLCWGNRNGLMITTLDTVPVLGSSSNDQRYHCCTLFPPMEAPKCISIWSDIHPRALQSIFRFRGQRLSGTLVPSLTSQSWQTGLTKTRGKHWLRRRRRAAASACKMHAVLCSRAKLQQRKHNNLQLVSEFCRLQICAKLQPALSL